MKKLKLLLAIVISFVSLTTFSQTKEETIDWLNTKFIECKLQIPGLEHINKIAIKLNNAKEPMLLFYVPYIKSYNMVNPKDIARLYTERAPNGNLNINVISKERRILQGTINTNTLEPVDYVFVDNFSLLLEGPDEEIYRLKKGIEHLITLLGGKIQEDNLFK
ncbi:MAG: hypothetical protein JNL03_01350 [Prolixibacteraceae bacterium]|nr:hypothetical protein [Prolixibacteraceae bacterium]